MWPRCVGATPDTRPTLIGITMESDVSNWEETSARSRSRYARSESNSTPWSYVLPGALAVMLGVLAADAIRLIIVSVIAKVAIADLATQIKDARAQAPLPLSSAASQEGVAPEAPSDSLGTPGLPGPMTAKRYRLIRSCIAGTISLHEENGWSQDLSDGSPKACVANSP